MWCSKTQATANRTTLWAPARRGAVSATFVVGLLLWLAVAAWLGWFLLRGEDQNATSAESSSAAANDTVEDGPATDQKVIQADSDSVRISFPSRELPDFEFPECQGGTVSRDSLKGKRWVASFVFTRCVTSCPMISLEIKKLHDRVAESNPDFRFVTFTVDASYDTAEVLQQYAEVYSADPERWKFVTGDEQEIHDLIRVGFTQYVAPNLGEDRRPGYEVAHTNRVVLVNEDSIPVATFLATQEEDMVKLRRILEGKIDFPEPGPPDAEGTGSAPPAFELRRVDEDAEQEEKSDTSGSSEEGIDDGDKTTTGALIRSATEYQLSYLMAPTQDSDAASPGDSVNQVIDERLPGWAGRLPPVNAVLNSISIILLSAGYAAIRGGHKLRHRNLMVSAFLVSVAFLGCYLVYHWALGEYTGQHGRTFTGPAWAGVLYYCILIPHVILAALVPFLSLRVFWLAFSERWDQHRRLARVTFPIWMFVSVTGVIIYGMLYHWPVDPSHTVA